MDRQRFLPDEGRFRRRERAAMVALTAAGFATVLDFFATIVALPSIGPDLGATPGALRLVVAAFAVAQAAGLIVGGRLGDMFGARRMFLVGIVLFIAGSVASALAPTLSVLVVCRILQGLAAALLQPQVLALLGRHVDPARRGRAFALYAASLGIGGVAGQVLGGLVLDLAPGAEPWRWCFALALPPCLAALAQGWARLPNDRPRGRRRPDLTGAALSATGLALLVWPLTHGREALGWGPAAALTAAGGVVLALLRLHQRALARRGGDPLIPDALWTQRGFVARVSVVLAFYAGVASYYLVFSEHLQSNLGLSPAATGGIFSAIGLAFIATSIRPPPLDRLLRGCGIGTGFPLIALAHSGLAATAAWPVPGVLLVPLAALAGVGLGLVMGPLLAAALAPVPRALAGAASGVLAAVQNTGNALGIALVTALQAGVGPARGSTAMVFVWLALLALAAGALWRRAQRMGPAL